MKQKLKEVDKQSSSMHFIRPHIHIITDIREVGNILYVGLARTASPTNTNFRLTFLLTQHQEALYENLLECSVDYYSRPSDICQPKELSNRPIVTTFSDMTEPAHFY